MSNDFLWVEKYRPRKLEDVILPCNLKTTFQEFVKSGSVPNLILAGSAGVGKTTIARAMLEEIGADYYMINASLDRNIDTLRNDIASFASTRSFTGGRKYVILDEADYLNHIVQPALRGFIEEFANNCGFILTCNFKNKIIPALHSRCSVIDFNISKKDSSKLATQFFKRVTSILDTENVTYDQAVVAQVINKHYPDWRRVLNELQRYSATGHIDSGILGNMGNESYHDLMGFMKAKNLKEVRKWVTENANNDQASLFNEFYNNAYEYFTPDTIPALILILAKYQYQSAFAANQEINISACLVEIIMECTFK